jgi:uncharacterized protein YqgQ
MDDQENLMRMSSYDEEVLLHGFGLVNYLQNKVSIIIMFSLEIDLSLHCYILFSDDIMGLMTISYTKLVD